VFIRQGTPAWGALDQTQPQVLLSRSGQPKQLLSILRREVHLAYWRNEMAYTVTIAHHSISRAPEYEAATIEEAKKIGDAEFNGGFNDHKIIVCDERGNTVAERKLEDDQWSDYE
jgi:hypothetical protein